MSGTAQDLARLKLSQQLADVVAKLELSDKEDKAPLLPLSKRRRRGVGQEDYSNLATLSLIDVDGALRWVYDPPPIRTGRRRAKRRGLETIEGETVASIPIKDLKSNEVLEQLSKLDAKLTPNQGLRRWREGKLEASIATKIRGKRILLMVHGTFSKSDMFFEALKSTSYGRKYLERAEATYDAILAFDHPTLCVSPWINALDLELALTNVLGKIDVICHSRGGLVTAWWLRLAKRSVQSVVFVGSPLAGTSLASPSALRDGLDYLGNVMNVLSATTAATSVFFPFAGVVTGIATTFAKVLSLGATTPIVDAGVAIVPGLAAQSRVRNNEEIRRMFASEWPTSGDFYAVTGNFLPDESREPTWKFWKRFMNIKDQLKYSMANMIFPGSNDLVVDTDCMIGPPLEVNNATQVPIVKRIEFKRKVTFVDDPKVHHCNYFEQQKTVDLLQGLL